MIKNIKIIIYRFNDLRTVQQRLKCKSLGLSQRSCGYESVLPLQGVRVQSLVRELRSHMLHGTAKKKKFKSLCSFIVHDFFWW